MEKHKFGSGNDAFRALLVSLGLALFATQSAAQDLRGPILAAASNFGQHFDAALLAAAIKLPVHDLRDAVYWDEVEQSGTFRFDRPETTFPDLLAKAGITMSLTLNNGHPDYDGGVTPYTLTGVAAYAHAAAETVRRFPAITAVEVGNEQNAQNFVTGPVKAADLDQRAVYYMALLTATHTAVKAANPNIRILGAGVHSIPLHYLARLYSLGAGAQMDALAMHPYTTPADQLQRQLALMRAIPGAATMPIDVTEFGTPDAPRAAAHLMRNYCQMALSGVTRTVWYPLNPRGDGFTPLIDAQGQTTGAGRAFQTAQSELEGRPVTNAAPDPFTYGCLFDKTRLLIWGAPRALTLNRSDLHAETATGVPATAPLALSEDAPLLILGTAPITLGKDVILGQQTIVADSFDQFTFPGTDARPGPFTAYSLRGGQPVAMETRPGQERPGMPWMPYLGVPHDGFARLMADELLPAEDLPIGQTYTAHSAERLTVEARFAPSDHSADGIRVQIAHNNESLFDKVTKTGIDFQSDPLTLAPGDRLSFLVSANGSVTGDLTHYRITLRQAAP